MSFQAYLDAIERKTGKAPQELLALAKAKGFTAETKAAEVVAWLNDEFGLGRGHAMAFFHVLKHGATIRDTHVGTGGVHADASDTLRLDGLEYRDS